MKRSIISIAVLLFLTQQMFAQQRPISTLVTKEVQLRGMFISDVDVLSPAPEAKKSVILAVVASLLIPGLGELYAGSFETGKYYLIAEGGLWLTYGGFRMHSNWLLKDAQTFASQHADANFSNKDDQYSVNIGNFNTIAEYNDAKSRNREYELIYQPTRPEYQWNWDTDANRLRFKDMRIHSGEVKNNAKFFIGAIVVNHLLSAFFAGKKTAAYNQSLSAMDDVEIHTYALNNGLQVNGWGISIATHF
jgi:TM2 domain-containing membrane protein YozV